MTVLAYHKVDDRFEMGLTSVRPDAFARQITQLQELGYRFSAFPEKISVDFKTISLTFDDAYDCFYRNVVPLLMPIRATATVFAITEFVGKKNSWDLRLSYTPFIHMNEAQLKEINSLGFEVGSHSCSHRDLTRLDNKTAWQELSDSKKQIEDLIGKEVISISFPYGRYNAAVVDQAREAGYRNLYGLGSSVFIDGVIGRIPVYRIDSPAAVRRKVEMNRLEVFKSDLIHSFANISALISVRRK